LPAKAQLSSDAAPPPSTQPSTTQPTATPPQAQAPDADAPTAIDDIELLEMEVPVVVTATRRAQRVTSVPYAMSVITAEDIRRSGARSIPDALRLVPGVDVADLTYGNAAVSPRGFHGFLSRSVLVLVDGRQVFDTLFGGTLWGHWPFQLEDIERIEVIRGPAGVTWGAIAVNGVINIITKDPADQLGLTYSGGGGSRGWWKQHLGYGFRDGGLRMRVSGEYEASDGFQQGGALLRPLQDQYRGGRFGLMGVIDAGPDDTLTISGGSSIVDWGFAPTPLAGLGSYTRPGSQANYLLMTWNHQFETDNALQISTYLNDFGGSPGAAQIHYRYQQLALLVSHTFRPAENHLLTWGVDVRGDMLDGSLADPFMLREDYLSTGIVGLYIQDDWRFAPRWTLHLGGRVDYEFYHGFHPSARAALSYELSENALLYGAVSRAVQIEPPGLLFLNIPMLNGLGYAVGDQDVDPEELIAYEVGYRARLFDRVHVSANAFWHDYSRLTTLSPRLGPPGLVTFDFDNRAAADLYGVELDARWPVTQELTLLGNYTYQQLNWAASVPYLDKELISPPRHKFMLGARYSPTENLHLGGHLYFVDATVAPNSGNPFGKLEIDEYFRLDLRAEYEFWDDRAALAVGVRNLLDPNHYEGGTIFLNKAEVPRMVYAELRVRFE
jgi:iron complex outermembrane receptor protein